MQAGLRRALQDRDRLDRIGTRTLPVELHTTQANLPSMRGRPAVFQPAAIPDRLVWDQDLAVKGREQFDLADENQIVHRRSIGDNYHFSG